MKIFYFMALGAFCPVLNNAGILAVGTCPAGDTHDTVNHMCVQDALKEGTKRCSDPASGNLWAKCSEGYHFSKKKNPDKCQKCDSSTSFDSTTKTCK